MSTVYQAGTKLSTEDTTVNPTWSLFSRSLPSCDRANTSRQAK